jgi:hypothetical protein
MSFRYATYEPCFEGLSRSSPHELGVVGSVYARLDVSGHEYSHLASELVAQRRLSVISDGVGALVSPQSTAVP